MLVKEHILKTSYDRENDILSIKLKDTPNLAYADNSLHGIELMRDMVSDELVGLIVYYPTKPERQKQLDGYGLSITLKDLI